MKTIQKLVFLFWALMILQGCDSACKAFGTKKIAPDEFLVYARPPLSQPPDFNLRPPKPGRTPKGVSSVTKAKSAIFDKGNRKTIDEGGTAGISPGINAFLQKTGANKASAKIRKIINDETTIYSSEDKRFVDKLIFWVDEKPYEGSIINPKKEERRIREAQALGKEINEGNTIHIKRKRRKKGLLEF